MALWRNLNLIMARYPNGRGSCLRSSSVWVRIPLWLQCSLRNTRRVAGVVEPTELEPQQAEMSHPFESDTLFKSNMLKEGSTTSALVYGRVG